MRCDWADIIRSSMNPNIILMLSGGKDSISALIKTKEEGLNVTAIHFYHKWSEKICTEEAERICSLYEIPLIKYDFSMEFFSAINGYEGGRPCLLCKKAMYSCLREYLNDNNFGWIAIGDNSNDKTTIARMNSFYNPFGDLLECSDYWGNELGMLLPENMHVLRPIIALKSDEVEDYLRKKNVVIRRINSTGDKYFEYHREGCPAQFAEAGYAINEELLGQLRDYNTKITQFARKKNILASIHLPSTFIVTIPEGFEKQAADYLKNNGLTVKDDKNVSGTETKIITAYIEGLSENIFNPFVSEKMCKRFFERLEISNKLLTYEVENKIIYENNIENRNIKMIFDAKQYTITIFFVDFDKKGSVFEKERIHHLIIEIFKTRRFIIE